MARWREGWLTLAFALGSLHCGSEGSTEEPSTSEPEVICSADEELTEDGSCEAPGVPPDGCSAGFEWVDGGCQATLPEAPCPPGTMALPGETVCREVAPCGTPPFGDIPVEANTQFVQQDFAGVSDGSSAAPWTTIGEAVAAAEPGAIVAVAPGTYAERVALIKPLRLWGLCPSAVTVSGEAGEVDAIFVGAAGAGSEIRNLAVTFSGVGVGVVGSQALLERIWIHDTGNVGVVVEEVGGAATAATLVGSLVEGASATGVRASGAALDVRDSVVRSSVPVNGDFPGRGIFLGRHPSSGTPAQANVLRTVVESNSDAGLFVFASTLVMEDDVVRDTIPYQDNLGYGVVSVPTLAGDPAAVEIYGSVLERNHSGGLVMAGTPLVMDRTTVRDTFADASSSGYGLALQNEPTAMVRGSGTITRSLFERSLEIGLFVMGSDLVAETLAVRDTLPRATDGRGGRGMSIENDVMTGERSAVTLERVRVERSGAFGLIATGADVVANRLHVTDTLGSQHPSLVFGDAVAVFTVSAGLATMQVTRSHLAQSKRAGVASFAANVDLADSTLECNPIQLTGESLEGAPSTFTDLGGNRCGCQGQSEECRVTSNGIEPPTAL